MLISPGLNLRINSAHSELYKNKHHRDHQHLRSKLYQKLKAPIDACLLQIFLLEEYNVKMELVIAQLIESNLISSASLSSNEPIAFNSCLSLSKSLKTNTFCFEHSNKPMDIESALNIDLVSTDHIPAIKTFLKEQVGMDDTFGYTENLVSRKEIFMVKESDVIIAISECRMSDSQADIADVGIIVNKDYQGRGIASEVILISVLLIM